MDSEQFITELEARLTSLAPEMIPGLLKKQLENVDATKESLTPEKAKEFVDNVAKALELFIGPDGSKNARKLMLRKLRQSCSTDELEKIMMQ
ncbi:MAG: hypothetical protein JSV49_10005 [Thermoplasmata archaeon]|nr:MAG: hypothetical protein JSV49_10005 [Thermoplasmata archaeon]